MIWFGFIDQDGRELECLEHESSHVAIAVRIIEKNFPKEYDKKLHSDPASFLVMEKGYLKLGNQFERKISYRVKKLTKIQKRIIIEYSEYEGYQKDPIFN